MKINSKYQDFAPAHAYQAKGRTAAGHQLTLYPADGYAVPADGREQIFAIEERDRRWYLTETQELIRISGFRLYPVCSIANPG